MKKLFVGLRKRWKSFTTFVKGVASKTGFRRFSRFKMSPRWKSRLENLGILTASGVVGGLIVNALSSDDEVSSAIAPGSDGYGSNGLFYAGRNRARSSKDYLELAISKLRSLRVESEFGDDTRDERGRTLEAIHYFTVAMAKHNDPAVADFSVQVMRKYAQMAEAGVIFETEPSDSQLLNAMINDVDNYPDVVQIQNSLVTAVEMGQMPIPMRSAM